MGVSTEAAVSGKFIISLIIILQLLQQKEIVHYSLKTRVILNYFTFFFSSIAIFSLGYIEPSITMVIPVLKKWLLLILF